MYLYGTFSSVSYFCVVLICDLCEWTVWDYVISCTFHSIPFIYLLICSWIESFQFQESTKPPVIVLLSPAFTINLSFGDILFIPHLPVWFSLFVLPERTELSVHLVFTAPRSSHPCEHAVTPVCSVVNGAVLSVGKSSWRDMESERWCMMRNFGSFCLFKISMASPLLPWGCWPFLGHLPTALLLSRLC